jgi:hypothetical protein
MPDDAPGNRSSSQHRERRVAVYYSGRTIFALRFQDEVLAATGVRTSEAKFPSVADIRLA